MVRALRDLAISRSVISKISLTSSCNSVMFNYKANYSVHIAASHRSWPI